MIRQMVHSSTIAEVGYEDGKLEVQFKDSKGNLSSVYEYEGVPVALYHELLQAESKGSFLAHNIKGHYDFRKVE